MLGFLVVQGFRKSGSGTMRHAELEEDRIAEKAPIEIVLLGEQYAFIQPPFARGEENEFFGVVSLFFDLVSVCRLASS